MQGKQTIIKNRIDIEVGIVDIIDRYTFVKGALTGSSAYTKDDCKERLALISERDILSNVLRMLDIQDFEIKANWVEVELV